MSEDDREDGDRDASDRDGHRRRHIVVMMLLLITILCICSPLWLTYGNQAYAADTTTSTVDSARTATVSSSSDTSYSGPNFETTTTTQADGTIRVRVSVTGKQQTATTTSRSNLIVLYDATGSMGIPVPVTAVSRTSLLYRYYDFSGYDLYAKYNGFIKRVHPTYTFLLGLVNGFAYDDTGYSVQYDTIYFTPKGNTETRMTIASDATKQLGATLLADDARTSITLVPFKLNPFNTAAFVPGQTTAFNTTVDSASVTGLTTTTGGQGTNWSSAFNYALSIIQNNPDIPHSILLMSDGEPNSGTTDMTQLANWINTNIGTQSNMQSLYYVSTSSDATSAMQNLATLTHGTLYNGTSRTDIQSALSSIATAVQVTTSYNHVTVSNTLASSMSFPLINGSANPDFTYYIQSNGGAETLWENAPVATVRSGSTNTNTSIAWDLSSIGTLDPHTTYILQYTVIPQQSQLDDAAAAALAGSTTVTSPVISATSLAYTQTTQIGNETPTSINGSYSLPAQPSSTVAYATLTIKATFTGNRSLPSSVTAHILRDNAAYTTVTLSNANGYTATIPVSIQHTYTVREEAPTGFTVNNPAALTLTGAPNQAQTLTITNTAILDKLRIAYIDTTHGETTAVQHGQFVVTNTATHDELILTIDAQGTATSNDALPDGTYTITQSQVPAGYQALSDTYTLTIAGNSWTLLSGAQSIDVSEPELGIKQITLATQHIDNTLPNAGGPLLWLYGIGFAVIMATTTVAASSIINKHNPKATNTR